MKLDDIIPDSISALVYKMRHPWLWTLGMWAVAFFGCWTMIPYNESYAGVAFASCACIAFVGAMPLIPGEHNTLHNIIGIIGCLLSQLWVALAGDWQVLFLWWWAFVIILLAMVKYGLGWKWCLVAEMWCLLAVVFVLTRLFDKICNMMLEK